MVAHRQISLGAIVAALAATAGCDAADRARARFAGETPSHVATGSGLALGLHGPGVLRPGDEGVLGLSVTNRSDTAVSRVRLELIVPGWVEPAPPRLGDPEVSMAALEEGGTRFTFLMDETPLDPQQTQTVDQRIRVPLTGPYSEGVMPGSRLIRARLLGPDGTALAEVESEIVLDGVETADTARTDADPPAARDRLGPVRLGMTNAELRQAVPAARDTTWEQEGMREQGVLAPLGGSERVLAVLTNDTVARIVVTEPATRTRERFGVGSRMDELRSAYGRACADVGEGIVVVWFPDAPGMSFALDAPVPQNVAELRRNPESIPASARVTHWLLRRGVDTCPA
jgi:hypothetical protein